jgi:hypothetical protein
VGAKGALKQSNSTHAQYVTLEITVRWKKIQNMLVSLNKWFWPSIFAQFAEAGNRYRNACQRRV